MKKSFIGKSRGIPITILVLILVVVFLTATAGLPLVYAVMGIDPKPGSEEDPLVTKSYIDSEIERYSAQINSKINLLKSELRSSKNDESITLIDDRMSELEKAIDSIKNQIEEHSKYIKFEVVELDPGQSIILKDSTEILLRAGKALAIAGEKGDGLADITTDSLKNNLITDDIVPLNHMLLVSRDDGRGIKAVTKIWVLVKGDYTINGIDEEENNSIHENNSSNIDSSNNIDNNINTDSNTDNDKDENGNID